MTSPDEPFSTAERLRDRERGWRDLFLPISFLPTLFQGRSAKAPVSTRPLRRKIHIV